MKQLVDIKLVKSNPNNPRTIKDDNFKKLVNSVMSFPKMLEKRPIVVDENMIVLGGNMRLRACKEAKLKEVWIDTTEDWTEEEKREFIIKDNVSGGEWDWDMLANEWDTELLDAWGLDVPNGFGQEEVEEDEAPEVSSEPPVSQLGAVYQLGRHRVMCGDSTKTEDVDALMEDKLARMVFTDPPWNVDYGSNVSKKSNPWRKEPRKIENDNLGDAFVPWLIEVFDQLQRVSEKGCPTYVVMSAQEWGGIMQVMENAGYHWSSTIIWNKDQLVFSRKDYHTKYEPIWYGWLDGAPRLVKLKDRKQTDVWDIDRPNLSEHHPTTKPLALVAKAINNSSNSEDLVVDMFLGSGSTLIACEQTDRTCYGMELDPKYVDVIRRRYWKFVNNGDETGWQEATPLITGVEND